MTRIHQGIDLVPIAKIRKVLQRNEGLAARIFTEGERAHCLSASDPYSRYAGRFAAKEACVKALGVGLAPQGIDAVLQDIEVVAGRSGKPELKLSGWAEKVSKKKRIEQLTVSISHSAENAVASVILVGSDKPENGPELED